MTTDDRVTDLETRQAFQDDTIQSLNDVLIKQQRQIDRLQAQMAAMLKRHEEMLGQFEIGEQDAPPPHY